MALKDWWEDFAPDDCLKIGSWEDMVDYIQHSACTDFTIYSECTIGGQAFRFTRFSTLSTLIGGATTGDDLKITANDIDVYPFIQLAGTGELYLDVDTDEEIMFRTAGVQFFMFDHNGTNSKLYGSAISGRDLTIYPNSSDTYPYIELNGNSNLVLEVDNDTEIIFKEGSAEFFRFDRSGLQSILSGSASSANDLLIYANLNDDCSALKLFGNLGATLLIKAASGFEVSTCSLETLWEVDSSPTDKHVDFHCLDAHNFVLELRTSDPSSPTCTGQIWFRTDLV